MDVNACVVRNDSRITRCGYGGQKNPRGVGVWVRFVAIWVGIVMAVATASGQSVDRFGDRFWRHWGDGKAELSGYALTFPRYGQQRTGTAVAIYVTETFDHDSRVKAEPDGHRPTYPVMKLNLVQDFPTGIYDYNLMTSVFTALVPMDGQPAGSVTKASFSCQEWCGHAYQQVILDRDELRHQLHSYFDGEADQDSRLRRKPGGICEDALLLWARGFCGPWLEPGQERTVPVLRSMAVCRLSHTPLVWDRATLSRSAQTRAIAVPAGSFEVETWSVKIDRQGTPGPRLDWKSPKVYTIEVEHAQPHRVIRWSTNDGYKAQMLASKRLKYWAMSGNGQERALEQIGLTPEPPETPDVPETPVPASAGE